MMPSGLSSEQIASLAVALEIAYSHEQGKQCDVQAVANMQRACKVVAECFGMVKP